jgi:hypothetical protein
MAIFEVDFRRRTITGTAVAGKPVPERDVAAVGEDDWPTTQCFSRHAGEWVRGADYAAAIERPGGEGAGAVRIAAALVAGALLGALVIVLCHAG